jgi:K+-transporting ATPase ATPase A chain
MSAQSILLLAAFLLVLLALAWPLGAFLAKVGDAELKPLPGFRWLFRAEKALYKLAGVKPQEGGNWKSYAVALLVFNTLGAFFVYAVQRTAGLAAAEPAGHGERAPTRPSIPR